MAAFLSQRDFMSKTAVNIFKLVCWALGLWFFFAILTPVMEDHILAWKRYNRIQEEQNLDSGALYYSNVPQTQEAEETTRRAVREGMADRRNAIMKARNEQN